MLANRFYERVADFSLGLNDPNEDAVLALCVDGSRSIVAVADGVGGAPRGDLVSKLAIQFVREELSRDFNISFDVLFSRAADLIASDAGLMDAATTLTVVRCNGYSFEVGHVGDSRAYHLRGFGLVDLTVDQNEGQFLIREGVFSKRDIQKYPRRNVLTSALSGRKSYELFKKSGNAQERDRILVVSDGVYEVLPRQEIAELNSSSHSLAEFMAALKERLSRNSLRDDSSAACLEIGKE
jgi:PPM family protein phosphatase